MPENADKIGNDSDGQLRRLITQVIRDCPKKRVVLAEEMTKLLDFSVTTHMLNDFTCEGKKRSRFPAAFIAAFCEATSDDRLQRFAAGKRLAKMIRLGENVAEMLAEDKRKTRKVHKT
jgi:hypothetical protein